MTLISGAINQYVNNNLGSGYGGNSNMWGAAAIGALGTIGTGLMNAVSSGRAARRAYQYSLQLQQHQQAYTTKMSNTAHQREVRDLRRAGLNPILSATGGAGASTPSAGSGSVPVSAAEFDNPVTSALAVRQQKNQNKLTESQNKLTVAQEEKTRSDMNVNDSIRNNYDWQDFKIQNDVNNANLTTAKQLQVMDSQIKQIEAQTRNIDESTKFVGFNAMSNRIGANASATNAKGSYYYNTHRALGFTDSYSTTSHDSYNNGGMSAFGVTYLPSKGGSSAYSVSRSSTR